MEKYVGMVLITAITLATIAVVTKVKNKKCNWELNGTFTAK